MKFWKIYQILHPFSWPWENVLPIMEPVKISQHGKYFSLSYDPYGPARAFIAKLLRKSPYEGRTRWREQGRKKPSGPARIAYGPHTGILSIARARCELKQLCCYINPDFSAKWRREISKFKVLTTTWAHNSKSLILYTKFYGAVTNSFLAWVFNNIECEQKAIIAK